MRRAMLFSGLAIVALMAAAWIAYGFGWTPPEKWRSFELAMALISVGGILIKDARLGAGSRALRLGDQATHRGGRLDHRITHQAVVTACRPLPGHCVRERGDTATKMPDLKP